MASEAPVTVFYGTFVDLPRVKPGENHELAIHHGALWVSSATGRIEGLDWSISSEEQLARLFKLNGWSDRVKIVRAREEANEFFFPGFIDTHIHAPQYPNSGLFGSSTLLDWLKTYTFPLESSMENLSTAQTAYNTVISRTLANGTTFASYFATIHVGATNLLATLCHARGQRALIGRVCMDNPDTCPSYYRDSDAAQSLAATRENIAHIRALDPEGRLVKPVITPRFAPSCTVDVLSGLGSLAGEHDPPLHIQTHISENKDEVELVKSLFPGFDSYAGVYEACSLLTRRTILAHAVHLTAGEMELIASRSSGVSHCPASNSALGSGIAPVRELLDKGVTVGLGTDVSGGYSPSILEATRQACLVSRLLKHATPSTSEDAGMGKGREVLSVEEALYLATRGGAAVVDMADDLGGFELGMLFDVQLIRLGSAVSSPDAVQQRGATTSSASESVVDIFGWESWREKVHKWVWTGNDRNVRSVWVGGVLVHSLDCGLERGNSLVGILAELAGGGGWWKWIAGGVGIGALGWVLGRRRIL
ncbi:chlorohydrolase family protein [Aspergillus lucknowensis]|uniref:Metallo-dependent hydrolase n=1 Tax=Aspergillus lucknowensis TaxID=176173 RepID=A0ABR4LQW4_9EURO